MAQQGGIHIITEPNSTRAISFNAVTRQKEPFTAATDDPLHTDKRTRVMIFAENFDLTVGDGLMLLKAEAEDGSHKRFALAVENMSRVPGQEWLTAITLRLPDGMPGVGDVFMRLSYQGVSSNRVRVGIGNVGGGLPDADVAAEPAPAPPAAPAVKAAPMPINYNDQAQAVAAAAGPDAVRFLEQATFGPTKAELGRVRQLGYKAWLDDQFNKPLPTYDPALFGQPVPSDSNQEGGCPAGSPANCINEKYTVKPLQRRFFQNAMYGDDQLRQRVAFALNQIFVVSGNDIQPASYLGPYYQVLDKHAFGNFRQLLTDITLSPAMGRYLDMANSTKNRPNENFAREILQLFSVGLYKLNPDGSYVKDDQGNPIPTYDQATINNYSKVFTGWNIPTITGQQGVPDYVNQMKVIPGNHDFGQKILLDGAVIPASQQSASAAADDLKYALDIIFQH
ncbi:MAG TPA: DUF1800 family protein, partial [Pyrinomonadaceae bacterium]|nr:DUF1800 family protein [Pyrinomonadaceae bacterium]